MVRVDHYSTDIYDILKRLNENNRHKWREFPKRNTPLVCPLNSTSCFMQTVLVWLCLVVWLAGDLHPSVRLTPHDGHSANEATL